MRYRRRRGVAIFVVLMVALILGALAAILWTGGPTSHQTEQSFEKRQAEYLAKGAQQHALLKCRLLPTELYDAVSYSIGRNPYYDFGLGLKFPLNGDQISDVDANRAPGPMFYTGNNQLTLSTPDADGIMKIKVDRTGDIEEGYGDQMYLLLNMFTLDISTLFPDPASLDESIVVVDSQAHADKAMGDGWRDPFIGNYKVQTLRILGLQGGRRYDRDTMLLTTIGSVKRAGQISIVTDLGGGARNLSPVRKMAHEASDDGFGEFSSSFESLEDFEERLGVEDEGLASNEAAFDDSVASGRRTEIATGIYYITRKAFN